MHQLLAALVCSFTFFLLPFSFAFGEPHIIQIVDEATGRGVPLVELHTTSNVRAITDSAGIVAWDEPGLMDRKVYFKIFSSGYEYPADGFGYRGSVVQTKPGQKTVIRLKRLNIAERLYRITGQGIYAESVKAGLKAPLKQPVLNGGVMGQDTVQTIEYQNKLFWFWGDTNRPEYPLGNFSTSGATSELPAKGGLDPVVGIDFTYFVDPAGNSRPMVTGLPKGGVIWIDALMVLPDEQGRPRLLARFARHKSLNEVAQRGLIIWDDAKSTFGPLVDFPLDQPLYPASQPFRQRDGEVDYLYFPTPYATVRVRADFKSVQDQKAYEAWTCLTPGSRYGKAADAALDRDAAGKLVWAWEKDTSPVREKEQRDLIKAGKLTEAESPFQLKDAAGRRVSLHAGTIAYNAFRKRWILIGHEMGGTASLLGECWYTEADRPEGPFLHGVKIATHEKYTFYNVVHHPQFDQENGRVVYFEGTYTKEFSGNPDATPRYDYNQIMYRLDLGDPRLKAAQ